MPPRKRPQEGVLKSDAGTRDREGFIAPSIGEMDHALYFTTAPCVKEKTRQILAQQRLALPGVVVVWDETIGRRKGSKAIEKGWWAGNGCLTAAFAFPSKPKSRYKLTLARTATAVLSAISSFNPREEVVFSSPNDFMIAGKKLGAVALDSYENANFVIVRLNCCNDLSKASPEVREIACLLVDYIDVKQLPLKSKKTLTNTLLTRLMVEIPQAITVAK